MARKNSRKASCSGRVHIQDRDTTVSLGPSSSNSALSPDPISYVAPSTLMASTSSHQSSSGRVNIQDRDRIMSCGPSSSSAPEGSADASQVDSTRVDLEGEAQASTTDAALSPAPIPYALRDRPKSNQTNTVKRRRGKCPIIDTWTISFGLFEHHEGGQNYILATNEIEKNKKNMYHIALVQHGEKWVVNVKKLPVQCNLTPILQVSNSPFQPRYNFPLQERLEGWKVKKTRRSGTKAWDKYYIYDDKLNFRSLVEVAVFLLYNCRREHLEKIEEILHEEQANENSKDEEAKDDTYSWVLANPIIDLDGIRL